MSVGVGVGVLLLLCFVSAVISVRNVCRREWANALLFGLPVLVMASAMIWAALVGYHARDARQKAMDRRDIPWEPGWRPPADTRDTGDTLSTAN